MNHNTDDTSFAEHLLRLPLLLNVDECAEVGRVRPRTVRGWIDEGLLPSTRARIGTRGGLHLVRRPDLLAFLGLSEPETPTPQKATRRRLQPATR